MSDYIEEIEALGFVQVSEPGATRIVMRPQPGNVPELFDSARECCPPDVHTSIFYETDGPVLVITDRTVRLQPAEQDAPEA